MRELEFTHKEAIDHEIKMTYNESEEHGKLTTSLSKQIKDYF
jgi:hypothetical protein